MTAVQERRNAQDARDGIESPAKRRPQDRGDFMLPEGLSVVSVDSHWTITEDIFVGRFPAHLKDRAPRLFPDEKGHYQWELNGQPMLPKYITEPLWLFDAVPGAGQMEPRLRDFDAEGVTHEIVFGNHINVAHVIPDVEVREWVYRSYNEYMADVAKQGKGRFHPVGFINYWDADRVRDSLAEVKGLGYKTFFMPNLPRGENNRPLGYAEPEMDPIWSAIEDSGLPVVMHVGESHVGGVGSFGISAMVNFAPFRKQLGELIFGGILDRHPGLQVVFTEGDINWVPGALQTAQWIYDTTPILDPRPAHEPEYYWRNHCYATFQVDPLGLEMLDRIGYDRVMWAADYPHTESTLGFGWRAMQDVIDAVPSEREARLILGDTAAKLFKIAT